MQGLEVLNVKIACTSPNLLFSLSKCLGTLCCFEKKVISFVKQHVPLIILVDNEDINCERLMNSYSQSFENAKYILSL